MEKYFKPTTQDIGESFKKLLLSTLDDLFLKDREPYEYKLCYDALYKLMDTLHYNPVNAIQYEDKEFNLNWAGIQSCYVEVMTTLNQRMNTHFLLMSF